MKADRPAKEPSSKDPLGLLGPSGGDWLADAIAKAKSKVEKRPDSGQIPTPQAVAELDLDSLLTTGRQDDD